MHRALAQNMKANPPASYSYSHVVFVRSAAKPSQLLALFYAERARRDVCQLFCNKMPWFLPERRSTYCGGAITYLGFHLLSFYL